MFKECNSFFDKDQNKVNNFVINIINGNNKRQQTLQNIPTVVSVTKIIQDSLPLSKLRDPDFLYHILNIVTNISGY